MKKQYFLSIVVVLFFCGLLVPLAFSEPEEKKVVIATAPDPQLATEVIVAEEKNYFKDEGLQVEIKLFMSGADLMSAVASNSISLAAAGAVPTVNLRAGGYP